ncbi:hypothetical protein JCM11251_004069 [Rhodosporidiobolus azoricus]
MTPITPAPSSQPSPEPSLSPTTTTTLITSRSPSRTLKTRETTLPGSYPSSDESRACASCFRRRRRIFERKEVVGEPGGGLERGRVLGAAKEGVGETSDEARSGVSALGKLFKRRKRARVEEAEASSAKASPAAFDCSRWMSILPDNAKLDELYIPGTHESLALYFPLIGSICQTTSLTSQLRGGIRFLDFRFSLLPLDRSFAASSRSHSRQFTGPIPKPPPEGGEWELRAYHGIMTQMRGAEEAFDEVYRWLESEEGRGEAVIISIKQENAAPSKLFASTLWTLLDRRKELWYTEERWPFLGEVRGKCILFCRFQFDGRGLHPPIWPNDNLAAWTTEIGKREVVVQDWYGLPSLFSIPQKAALALSLLSPSPSPPPYSSPPPPTPLRITFLSAARLPFLPPSLAAKGFGFPRWRFGVWGVNDLVERGIEERKKEGRLVGRREGEGGCVVVMDFWESPGRLVESVVGLNFP